MEMLSYIFLLLFVVASAIAVVFFIKSKKANAGGDQQSKQIDNYQSIIDQANDAMLVIDIVDGRIHQSNPSAATMLGYSQEELAKKSLFHLHPKEDLEKSSRIVADVWEKGGLIYKDVPFVHKNGDLLPVECSAKVAPFSGRPAIVIYARDIRERLRLEKEVQIQAAVIEQKNKDITDSISYAKRIQESILPTDEELTEVLSENFVYYRPKDIVSGDFYWASSVITTPPGERESQKLAIIAAVDCTGHGVPGAFMSIIGHALLEQTRTAKNVNSPAEALDYLSFGVVNTLKQHGDSDALRDGMDVSMCAINWSAYQLEFAGANNPLYLIRNGELMETKGDKQPAGRYLDEAKPFTNHKIKLQSGDCLYIFTDGIADQFGGERGKKFKYAQLQNLLKENWSKSMKEQKQIVKDSMERWMNPETENSGYEQTDDMLLIGVRIP
jgi:PAS domain S-box-containing protein